MRIKKKTLHEVMGRKSGKAEFKGLNEYSEHLNSINKAALQTLCIDGGLMPAHDRRMMIRALEKLFKKGMANKVTTRSAPKLKGETSADRRAELDALNGKKS